MTNDTDPSNGTSVKPDEETDASARRLTIPNLLCAVRLAGAPVLLVLAILDLPRPFLFVFIGLMLTDWLDGKIARWLKQRSTFGARLDSLADGTMYSVLAIGTWLLKREFLIEQWPWLVAAAAAYIISATACLIKFRRLPSYHNRAAKISWFLVFVAAIFLFGELSETASVWTLRIAMIGVVVANLECTAITIVITKWRADVLTLYHAIRDR